MRQRLPPAGGLPLPDGSPGAVPLGLEPVPAGALPWARSVAAIAITATDSATSRARWPARRRRTLRFSIADQDTDAPRTGRGHRLTRMASYVAALDQGTTSTRLILFDADGRVAGSAQREHRQVHPEAGWVEHDALEI